ncbi:angiopoietin-related protein 7-like [Pecten maximus]|uniref:angiopoietin-related protein 7-like n=1 Tax=Pecten maximus TaxID=6579 RepID=UPI0014590392|nr:angiopoietin-related protein 7-like [Pecten maximus]
MDTPDGPWTVIQNRQDGQVDFYRSWEDYKNGFGNIKGNFWLGNEAIHRLALTASVLRIELVSWLGDARYAQYSTFRVENETANYRLTVSGFSGNVTENSMAPHNGMSFSTFDRDNDESGVHQCATLCKGGWWYNSCYGTNLNGAEYKNDADNVKQLVWKFFYPSRKYAGMRKTKMLVKRIQP